MARSIHADPSTVHLPSSALGWAAWPLALVWHLLLLRAQPRWIAPRTLAYFHAAGVWLFVLVAARECQARLGDLGDAYASGPLLGWVLVPLLAVWALRCSALLARWPLTAHRRAYLEWALTPLAFYLFGWCWLSNVVGTGDAASLPLLSMLPFVPVLNPLELVQWLALAVLLLWCKSVEGSDALTLDADLVKGVAVVTAWALVTGSVLRACHHYAGVPWQAAALYASWLTQAALSITWALCGVAAMVVGGGKGTRAVWLAGAVLIGVVVVKLFFVELANQGGLFRIVSFIAVGALLLLVGYFAPVPPARPVLREASAE